MMTTLRIFSLVLLCGLFLTAMACQTKEKTGAAVGGATGAGLGAAVGGEEHRAEGAIIGGLVGGAAGYFAGTRLSEDDQMNVYDVLENTPTGETETWTSENGVTYYVTPTDTWEQEGRRYRSLDIRVEKPDGEDQDLERVAYKTAPDAKWQLTERTAEDIRREDRFYDDQYDERRERGYFGDEEQGTGEPEIDKYDPESPQDQMEEGIFW